MNERYFLEKSGGEIETVLWFGTPTRAKDIECELPFETSKAHYLLEHDVFGVKYLTPRGRKTFERAYILRPNPLGIILPSLSFEVEVLHYLSSKRQIATFRAKAAKRYPGKELASLSYKELIRL